MRLTRIDGLVCALLASAVLAWRGAAQDDEPLQVTVGEARREYSRAALALTYAAADSRSRRAGATQTYPYYYQLRTFKTAQRVYRVHVPLEIQARGGLAPRARVVYAFQFSTRQDGRGGQGSRARRNPNFTDMRWADVVLQPGKHDWHITSEWMVEADRSLFSGADDLIVRTREGQIKIVQRRGQDETVLGRVIDTFFPYQIHYWAAQDGCADQWLEEEFPRLIVRNVNGDEVYDGLVFMVFPDDENLPATGNMSDEIVERFIRQLTGGWESPYPPPATVTNRWQEQAWATNVMRLDDAGLRVAYLSRIVRSNPTDLDAADLLMRSAVQRGDSEQIARVYAICRSLFPGWKEYWFRQYLGSLSSEETRRAALAAFRLEEPRSVFVLQTLADLYITEERLRSAKRLLNEWLAIESSNVHALARVATIAKREGRMRDMRVAQGAIVRLIQPGDAAVTGFYGRGSAAHTQYLQARNFIRADDGERALAALRRSTQSDPAYYPSLLRTAQMHHQRAVAPAALSSYRETLAACSNHPAALRGLAVLYQEAGQTRSAQRAQEQLWRVLAPLAERERQREDWTNVATVTRYVLDALPAHRAAQLMHADALTRLGLYDDASAMLWEMSGATSTDVEMLAAWARLCEAIDADTRVLVLQSEPAGWLARADAAWAAVLQLAPRDPQALLARARLAVRAGDMPAAYRHAQALYTATRWPAAAGWLAELCLRQGRAQRSATLPGLTRRLYVEEAAEMARRMLDGQALAAAQPAVSLVRTPLAVPESYALLAEALHVKNPDTGEAEIAVRAGVRRFPAAPIMRAMQASRMLMPQGAPALLWQPYTNAFESAAWHDWRLNEALISLYEANTMPRDAAMGHLRAALQLLQWHRVMHAGVRNKEEFERPGRYYEIENDNGWRFRLRRHAFVVPAPAYAWYAIRSRYTESELTQGSTRWWQRQELLRAARAHLQHVARVQAADPGWTTSVASVWLDNIRISDATACDTRPVSTMYAQELRSCFYRSVTPVNVREQDFSVRIPSARVSGAVGFGAEPARWGDAAPDGVRHLLAPLALLLRCLPPADAAQSLPLSIPGWRFTPCTTWRWPDDPPASMIRSAMEHDAINATQDARGLRVVQALTAPPTSFWQGVCITPCLARGAVPLLPSPFAAAHSGEVNNVTVEGPGSNVASMAIVIAPLPLPHAMQQSGNEALMLEWTWAGGTALFGRIYARTPGRDNGMPLDAPGMRLAEALLPLGSSVWWRMNGQQCEMGSMGGAGTVAAEHGLSRGMWEAGAVINVHIPAVAQPFVLTINELSAAAQR